MGALLVSVRASFWGACLRGNMFIRPGRRGRTPWKVIRVLQDFETQTLDADAVAVSFLRPFSHRLISNFLAGTPIFHPSAHPALRTLLNQILLQAQQHPGNNQAPAEQSLSDTGLCPGQGPGWCSEEGTGARPGPSKAARGQITQA